MLGTFCVDATTPHMEQDPANLLPRISLHVEPQKPDSATVFLINSANNGLLRAFPFAGANVSAGCEKVMEVSTATMFAAADTGFVVGSSFGDSLCVRRPQTTAG